VRKAAMISRRRPTSREGVMTHPAGKDFADPTRARAGLANRRADDDLAAMPV
jgi:hypothetical protein